MKVKLEDILEAIELSDQFSEAFLDKETGEIVWTNDFTMSKEENEAISDMLDEHGFYRLPTSYDINEYGIMEDFVDSVDGSAGDALSSAIQGHGAFRRFKSGIRRYGVEEQWYDFEQKSYRKLAKEWCKENGIEWY